MQYASLPLRHFTDHQVSFRLHYAPDRLAHIRRIVTALLSHWELDHLADDASLITTELVGNVRHSGSASYELTLRRGVAGAVHVEVRDSSHVLPQLPPGPPAADRDSGRGLLLVAALASDSGVVPLLDGKAVWATLTESSARE